MVDHDAHSCGAAPEPLGARVGLALIVFVLCLGVYVTTLAPGTVFGDPSEYQFIPAIWGIAHPPGYAVYTLVAGLWQRFVTVGSVAYRTNLLAACAGAWTASRVALIAYAVTRRLARSQRAREWSVGFSLLAGVVVGLTPDVWQQSIHANAHIMSAAITSTQLWALVRWWVGGRDGWLYFLAWLVGTGVTHHPITVWGIPAYLVFIVISRPRILVAWRTILAGVLYVGLGMLPWLYFPLRSASVPFGPTDMGTWTGFLRHATAQGLRVNLFHFGLLDQPDRLQVFGTLLLLQYGWVLLAIVLLGVVRLLVEAPRLGLLWLGYLIGHLAFTMNSVQDVMAYLLHPFTGFGLPLAVGLLLVWEMWPADVARRLPVRAASGVLVLAVIGGRAAWSLPRVSLKAWQDADGFIADLHERFDGQRQGATLVSDWEHLTPYFYYTYVESEAVEPADMDYVYVTGATPWVESVFGSLANGPTYLSNYRRDVRTLGFRLRPEGNLWRVLEPPALASAEPEYEVESGWVGDQLQLIGYDLGSLDVVPGDVIPVTLYARVTVTQTDILMPMAHLGEAEQRWTTDSRRLTPEWQPGEIIVERYHVYVPYSTAEGRYPLNLSYLNLSRSGDLVPFSGEVDSLELGEVRVGGLDGQRRSARVAGSALVNIGNEVALVSSRARAGLSMRSGTWDKPLTISPGQSLHLRLSWQVLASPTASYTVFIHLLDDHGALCYGHDYTPLGGAFPSYLWFPKWLEGQRVVDPYRLVLPDELPAGTYWLEVGMYEMGSVRRVSQLNSDGTMTGDRFILGAVEVRE